MTEKPKVTWPVVVKGAIPYVGAMLLWPLICLLIYLDSGTLSVEQTVAVAGAVAVLMGIQRFSGGNGSATLGTMLLILLG